MKYWTFTDINNTFLLEWSEMQIREMYVICKIGELYSYFDMKLAEQFKTLC